MPRNNKPEAWWVYLLFAPSMFAFAVYMYFVLTRLEMYGGSIRTNVVIVGVYKVLGRWGVVGLLICFGIACGIVGIVKLSTSVLAQPAPATRNRKRSTRAAEQTGPSESTKVIFTGTVLLGMFVLVSYVAFNSYGKLAAQIAEGPPQIPAVEEFKLPNQPTAEQLRAQRFTPPTPPVYTSGQQSSMPLPPKNSPFPTGRNPGMPVPTGPGPTGPGPSTSPFPDISPPPKFNPPTGSRPPNFPPLPRFRTRTRLTATDSSLLTMIERAQHQDATLIEPAQT